MGSVWGEGAKCGLHPLIHTWLELDLSPNIAVCQRDLLSRYDNEVVSVK
jgi:hypothetical protein